MSLSFPKVKNIHNIKLYATNQLLGTIVSKKIGQCQRISTQPLVSTGSETHKDLCEKNLQQANHKLQTYYLDVVHFACNHPQDHHPSQQVFVPHFQVFPREGIHHSALLLSQAFSTEKNKKNEHVDLGYNNAHIIESH